jgi:uncharacterized protein YqhQ
MMKSPQGLATAVRRPDGSIVYRKRKIGKSQRALSKIPFLRGVVILLESLFVGTQELTFAANQSGEDEEELSKGQLVLTLGISLSLGVGLFMVLPSLVAGFAARESLAMANALEGVIRVGIFVAYIYGISFSKDIRRVFEYHGAEHKSIYTFENNEELKKENAKKYTTLHPRCGTSFLFIVMLCSIFVYSVVDSFIPQPESLLYKQLLKVAIRVGFMPIIAGISYEIQRLSSRHMNNPFFKVLASPGLALQKITTKEPDLDELEVSMVALRASLNENIDNANEIEEENN